MEKGGGGSGSGGKRRKPLRDLPAILVEKSKNPLVYAIDLSNKAAKDATISAGAEEVSLAELAGQYGATLLVEKNKRMSSRVSSGLSAEDVEALAASLATKLAKRLSN